MKISIATIVALVASISFATAAEKIKAPNNGRIIDSVEPHAEFLVTKEKKIEIRFLDDAGNVIAPAAQIVSVVMGDRSAPTKLAFTKDGDKLVSAGRRNDTTVFVVYTPPSRASIMVTSAAHASTPIGIYQRRSMAERISRMVIGGEHKNRLGSALCRPAQRRPGEATAARSFHE